MPARPPSKTTTSSSPRLLTGTPRYPRRQWELRRRRSCGGGKYFTGGSPDRVNAKTRGFGHGREQEVGPAQGLAGRVGLRGRCSGTASHC
nr:hypothetical protein CFP56_29573 [Quercus suber]